MSDAGRYKNIMLGTAGHVDHGKTALVKLLTGCNTDRLREEQERGLTIELGFAPCQMADERIVGIVDVPGHVGFIKNMVAGAHGIDVVMLIVAADDGVMPQTREHLDILTLMGCRYGLVALTKIDLIDAELREMATSETRDFLAGTFLADAPICPVSNITGEGFAEFSEALNAAVDAAEARPPGGHYRQWVEKVFSIKGFGTIVTGIPSAGEVRSGERLRLLPGDATPRVRSLQVYGEDAEVGRAGECVAINLSDIDAERVDRGMLLTGSETLEPVEMFEADLAVLPGSPPLKDNTEVHLHVGTAECMAVVANLAGEKAIAPGGSALVQLRASTPLPVAIGERFVIRGTGGEGRLTTLGGGRILDVSNIRLRRKRPWTLQQLTAQRDALDDPHALAAAVLAEAQGTWTAAELARRLQWPLERTEAVLADLLADGRAMEAAGNAFAHETAVANAADKLVDALEAFHEASPLRAGAPRGELFADIDIDTGLLGVAEARLTGQGRTKSAGDLLTLVGQGAKLSEADRDLAERIEATLAEAGVEPPRPDQLAEQLAAPLDHVEAMLQLLCDEGRVIRLDAKVAMAAQAVERAKQVVLDLFSTSSGFDTMAFRDALGVSRKYAVPLLDYFDSRKLTVRTGNRRTPGAQARKAMGRD